MKEMPRSAFLDGTRAQANSSDCTSNDNTKAESDEAQSSPSENSTHSRSDTEMTFDPGHLSPSANSLLLETNGLNPTAEPTADSPPSVLSMESSKRFPSPGEMSSSPEYQSFQDVNLDFFDMGSAQSSSGVQFVEGEGKPNDMDWANDMLDEMLNAIPA